MRIPTTVPVEDVGEALVRVIGSRARNLLETGQLFCSEAVLTVLNRGLGGGLPEELAIRLAAALPQGLGDSGCTCGALSGGALALGLFLGRDRPGARDNKRAMPAANLLHENFRNAFGSSCCRVLTRKVKGNPKAHLLQCAHFTGDAAEMAARIILETHPELIENADWDYLRQEDTRIGSKVKQLFGSWR